MRSFKLLFCVLFAFLCCLTVFSSMSLNASASDYTMMYMSQDVFRAALLNGRDHLNGYYYSTSGVYKPCTFVPRPYYTMWVGSDSVTGIQEELAQAPCLTFGCTDAGDDIAVSGNPVFPLFKIELNLHFGNVRECYFGANYHVGDNSVYWNTPVQTFRPYSFLVAGSSNSSAVYLSANSSGFPNRAWISAASGAINNAYSAVLGSFQSNVGSDLYISEYNCCAVSGLGEYNISLILPKINNDYILLGNTSAPSPSISSSHITGTITDSSGSSGSESSGSQHVDITVETDNSGLVGGIIQGIKNLFVPSDDFLDDFHGDLEDAFNEHLGGVAEAVSLLDEQADYLRAATSAEYIYFPELTLPIGSSGYVNNVETIGADYTLIERRQVELRPARDGKLKILWDFVEFAVDAVCVIAVFNMLQTKYEIFLNPDGEVISYDS